MKLIRVGVDLAKNVFQLHGVDRSEKAVWRRKLVRGDWIKGIARQIEPGCEIGMEACSGAHHWARLLQAQGYRQADCSAVRQALRQEQQERCE
jgi:transposase